MDASIAVSHQVRRFCVVICEMKNLVIDLLNWTETFNQDLLHPRPVQATIVFTKFTITIQSSCGTTARFNSHHRCI